MTFATSKVSFWSSDSESFPTNYTISFKSDSSVKIYLIVFLKYEKSGSKLSKYDSSCFS